MTNIQRHINLSQAQTSHHLKMLFDSGLIRRRPQGTSVYYMVSNGAGRKLLPGLRRFKALWRSGYRQPPS